jgi:hypothetical protein
LGEKALLPIRTTGFHRTLISSVDDELMPLPIGGITQARLDVIHGQIIEVLEYLLGRHTGGQVFQYVVNRNPETPNAGFAAALVRLDGDKVPVIHHSSR